MGANLYLSTNKPLLLLNGKYALSTFGVSPTVVTAKNGKKR